MVILGLGSNKGDRAAYLRQASALLAGLLQGMGYSSVYESKALMPEGAPKEWDMPFLNMAVMGETSLSPLDLLKAVKAIEKQLGRKSLEHWSPREIDIDILAIDQQTLDLPEAQVPHRELLNREFALLPLVELAPDWEYPAAGKYQGWKASAIAKDKGWRAGVSLKRWEHKDAA